MAGRDLSLVEFVKIILGLGPDKDENIELRDWFLKDPDAALEYHGLGHLTAEDVRDAAVLLQDNDTVSFDRSYDTGFDWDHGNAGWAWKAGSEGHHEGGHKHGAEHEKVHVKDNFYEYDVNDRDTVVDNSINQNIDTDGGDFRQDIDTNSVTASGDGAVAAGRDIEDSTITTGNGNAVGDGNAVVNGDDNQVAFGDGSSADSYGDITADDGGAVAIGGGDADGDNSVNDSFNEETTTTTTTNETSFEDSFNTTIDDSVENTTTDSGNTNIGNGLEANVDLDIA
ncbi:MULTISPECIES: hypothetical protein [Pseudonocardia]|uniref:Uncharacterized protein n=1 Tax=Pseudonocardia alni TaxID=33907 RepID=A0A852W3B9_PSEA5|nr:MULTISPECIES: hypothetical protein [Pseudonocardia]MCO7196142.1 hypothetical protein [Pseudonocardia sp. McavD-2-B]NYG02910.1 hypothetical protein [Pseudonocardia antarctica]